MRTHSKQILWISAFLLIIFAVGCSCSDEELANALGLTAPTILSVAPPSGSSGNCPNTVVTATFAQAMDPSTLTTSTFTLTGPGGTAVAGSVAYDSGSSSAVFTPTAALELGTAYTARITTGARDLYGNALAADFTSTFTTGVVACSSAGAPTVGSVTPANGACPNTPVTATFSEAMNPTTINGSTFTLAGPGSAGTVTYNVGNLTAFYTPTAALSLNTTYTATITTGAQDLSGTGLANNRVWTFTTAAVACTAPVPLLSAGTFKVLAGSTVTNTGPTIITGGNVGLSPGSAVTGFPPGTLTPPAVMHIANAVAAQAQFDLTAAYNYAAGVQGALVLPGEMSGLTFTPGVYKTSSTTMLSAGNVTLDAQGDANAVFLFQIGSTLTTLGGTQIVLAGGAQAQNVYWQVGSSATLGTNSIFKGTIMALQSITLNTGANLEGRALARNGAVTLDASIIH